MSTVVEPSDPMNARGRWHHHAATGVVANRVQMLRLGGSRPSDERGTYRGLARRGGILLIDVAGGANHAAPCTVRSGREFRVNFDRSIQ